MNDDRQRLSDFAKAIAVPLFNTDGIKWPIRSGNIISLVGDIFSAEYICQMQNLVCKKHSDQWKTAIPSSLSIWRMAHHIINGMEKQKLDKKTIAQHCLLMIDIIDVITNHEQLYRNDHNILNKSDINNISVETKRNGYADKTNDLLYLSTLLWAYTEALYFQGREISCEYHGPYRCQDDCFAIVRDFSNLEPKELWPELVIGTHYDKIRIVTIHNNELSFSIDAYNNVNIPKGNFQDTCTNGLLYINGISVSSMIISSLIKEFEYKLTQQLNYVNSMSDTEIYLQYLNIFWYRKKKLADFLSEDWRPPIEAINRIMHTEIKPININIYRSGSTMKSIIERYDYSIYL